VSLFIPGVKVGPWAWSSYAFLDLFSGGRHVAEQPEITWKEVVATHGSQAGIATKGSVVRSLLANQAKEGSYADEIREDTIFYRVTDRTNPTSVQCLREMVGTVQQIHVFEKLGKNRWRDHGKWIAADAAEEEGGTLFLLKRPATP
jgi:hypothetical protein